MKVKVNTQLYKNTMKEKEINFTRLMISIYENFGFEVYQSGVSQAINGKSFSLRTHMVICEILGLSLDDIFILDKKED
ncbi:helix-turn-helix domain-containing protein [Clostridium sp.]|uniref:helix-turn-helix domain-containing protein n=1 Tax=Clostridium sp. TaxID=1506 RepID=UPI00261EC76E